VIQILLADDNEFVRTALVELFDSTGDITVVAECEDGDQVLAAVRETTPDVVVLDLAVPGRTGLEAARVLLSVDPGARIILLTGNPSPAAVREAKEIGLAGYLLKGRTPPNSSTTCARWPPAAPPGARQCSGPATARRVACHRRITDLITESDDTDSARL
jgi:DNA-binding NarL/FixJ family response regulator